MQLCGTKFENSPRGVRVLKNQHFLAPHFALVLRLQFDQYPHKHHSTVPLISPQGISVIVRVRCVSLVMLSRLERVLDLAQNSFRCHGNLPSTR